MDQLENGQQEFNQKMEKLGSQVTKIEQKKVRLEKAFELLDQISKPWRTNQKNLLDWKKMWIIHYERLIYALEC